MTALQKYLDNLKSRALNGKVSPPKYEIRPGKHAPCELWSCVVRSDTWCGDGHEFWNYVCEGTYTYCNEIKERLEK